MSDCYNVRANIVKRTYNATKLKRLILLTEWLRECLEKIRSKERFVFPVKEEEILFNEIKAQIKLINPDLKLFDMQDFRFISISEHDYKVQENLNFNKFIVKCLFSSYISILAEIPNIKKLPLYLQNKLNDWGNYIEEIKKDNKIRLELDPNTRAKTDKYLIMRRDIESLYTIDSIITSLKDTVQKNNNPDKVRLLALQRILHTAGENLKDASPTATVSSDLKESLEKLGIPVNLLNIFRDMLTHNQVYSLLTGENEYIEKFFEGCGVIQKLIQRKMIELQNNFIVSIIGETQIDVKFRKVLTKLSRENDLMTLRLEIERKMALRIPEEQKQSLGFLYQNVNHMLFNGNGVSKSKLSKKDVKSLEFVTQHINQVRSQIYKKLQSQLKSWDFEKFIGELRNANLPKLYLDAIEVGQVIDHLNYKNKDERFLNNFLERPILKEIYVRSRWTLKEELERYIDENFIKNDNPYVAGKDNTPDQLVKHLSNNMQEPDDNAKKLITFLKSGNLNNKDLDTYISPKEYNRLVYGLDISRESKSLVLSLSVASRKQQIVYLLKKYFPLVTIFENVMEGKVIDRSVFDMLVDQYKLKQESKVSLARITESFNTKVQEFYKMRVTEEWNVFITLNHAETLKTEFITLTSLVDKIGKAGAHYGANDPWRNMLYQINEFRKKIAHFPTITNQNDINKIDNILVNTVNEIRNVQNTKPNTVEDIMTHLSNMQKRFSLGNAGASVCPSTSRRNRRYAGKSCWTWEEIDKITEEGVENIDPDTIRIDGEKFIRSIVSMEHEANEEKISNAIALASDSVVTGDHTSKINMLTENHRFLGHLGRVGQVSGMVMHGMIIKDLVADIFHGDYEDFAKTIGILAIGAGLQKAAEIASLKGASYILKSRAVLGNTLRVAAPYLARGASAFIAWDLYQQVQAYKEGNKDALVYIIGDSVQLGVDVGEIGIEIGEVFGLLSGVSAYTGPIGIALGALVLVGTNVYTTVRTVQKIDEHIHLSGLEQIAEGIFTFFGESPSDDIQQKIGEKEANNQEVKRITCLLKDNPHIRRYVFPSIELNTEEGSKFFAKTLRNVVLLDKKKYDIKWSSTRPNDVKGFDLFCQPKGDWEYAPDGGTYYCDNAIGVEYLDNKTVNNTWISLGDGDDMIRGFPDSSNIVVFGDGRKSVYGGNKDDSFIFEGKSVDASSDSKIIGIIAGEGGINTIDAGKLTARNANSKEVGKYQVSVDFYAGVLKDTSNVRLHINDINVFLGRKGGVDEVLFACDTKHVDGRGGENKYYLDSIIIPKDDYCFYNSTVTVNPYTKVTNNGARGKFRYIVKGEKGKEAYIELDPSSQSIDTFVFYYALTDVAAINKSEENITFSFVDKFYEREKKIDVNSSFNLTVSGADKNTTTFHLTDLTNIVIGQNYVYALQNTKKPIVDLVKDYSSIADKSEMYVVVYSNDEVLTVGHKHGDILRNDPNARASHLASGSGENIFVISSGHESITLANLPISDVVIYDFDQGDEIDTLDLREVNEQIKKDIDREINTDVSKIASDLLITLSLDDESKQEVVKIRLKDALENNWHERLHVVIDNIFVLKEILGDIQLTPQPLILDNSKNIYVINPTDVAKGSKIIVKTEIGYYSFARNIDALVITNSLSSSTAENNVFTILLNDFYYGNNRDKMHSLKIEFDDKTILLRREIERINSAGNFSELTTKLRNDRYKTAIYTIKTQKLFEAIEGNNIGEVKEFIEHGVRIDARNNAGQTPLHVAALNGNLGIVKYLVEEKHADVNVNDNPGIKSLYCAVSGSTLDVIKYLVRTVHGHVNVKANYGIKPLHYAAFSGNLEVVKYLVEEKHADVNVKDNYEITPLHYAASSSSSSLSVVKYLVEKRLADINVKDIYEITPLQYAALGGNLEVVKYLVDEKRARLYASDNSEITILYYAVFSRNLEVVKYLVEEKHVRVDLVDDLGLTLLHYAASRSSLNVVKYLVEEKHADANAVDNNILTPLYYAAAGGNLEVLKYLLKDNSPDSYLKYAVRGGTSADFNNLAEEPNFLNAFLHYVACDDNLGVIKYLIEEKHADVKGKDNFFRPAQFPYIVGVRSLNVVKYFLAVQDADVNVEDKRLWATFFYAVHGNNLEVVKYLVEQEDAGINLTNYFSSGVFEILASDANLELVKYLVGKGADVNPTDNSVTTPLHDAAKSGSLEVVKYLIKKGARIDIKLNGETPLNILERNGYKHVVDSIVENLTERLFDAVKYDDYYEVQNLLDQGVSPNVRVGGEETLLYFAARNGKLKVVKYLVEQMYPGGNVKDYVAVTPLQVVDNTNIDKANTDIAKYLGGKHADVNLEDLFRWTATFNGSSNVQTRFYRQAPLDLAVAGNYSNIVKHLESKVNVKRETPQEHERNHHHPSRRLLTTDSTDQSEIATSNASEKSLWINDLGGSIVKSQKSSAPSETASSNRTIRQERRKRHNDHSRHEDGMRMRTHRIRRRHRRVQKRNVKYQDSHYYTDQPEIAASSGTRPSSWINGLVDWIKEKGGGLVSSMANKSAGKELEDPKSRGIDACSVRLEKMYSDATPNIPQSRKSQGVPIGNIPNTSWSGWSSDQENVRSNVTDAPEMNTIVLNCALILGDLAVRLVNGTRHKQPIHENLLSPREKSMRFIDENMIMRTIQQGKEKFGGLATNMDEEQIWNWEISG